MKGAASLAALVCGLLAGCGPKGDSSSLNRDLSQFECNDRRVAYMVAGGFAAEETGITIECDGENPRLTSWRSDDGERSAKTSRLSGEQYDAVWKAVDSTGWRFVEQDCKNADAKDGDPAYIIEVADHAQNVTLNCEGTTLPFPYDRIVNELDLRAVGMGDQDGAE